MTLKASEALEEMIQRNMTRAGLRLDELEAKAYNNSKNGIFSKKNSFAEIVNDETRYWTGPEHEFACSALPPVGQQFINQTEICETHNHRCRVCTQPFSSSVHVMAQDKGEGDSRVSETKTAEFDVKVRIKYEPEAAGDFDDSIENILENELSEYVGIKTVSVVVQSAESVTPNGPCSCLAHRSENCSECFEPSLMHSFVPNPAFTSYPYDVCSICGAGRDAKVHDNPRLNSEPRGHITLPAAVSRSMNGNSVVVSVPSFEVELNPGPSENEDGPCANSFNIALDIADAVEDEWEVTSDEKIALMSIVNEQLQFHCESYE
jgi:hypothetical protein